MNRKQLVLVIATIVMVSTWLGAAIYMSIVQEEAEEGRVKVVATFYPLGHLARRIGGDRVSVTTLIPENTEVHGWQPSISDILEADEADVILYHGLGLDSWFDDEVLPEISSSDKVIMETTYDLDTVASELSVTREITDAFETSPTALNASTGNPPVEEGVHYNVSLNGTGVNSTGSVTFNASHDSSYIISVHPSANVTISVTNSTGSEIQVHELPQIPWTMWTFELARDTVYRMDIVSDATPVHFVLIEHELHEGDVHGHDRDDPHTWISPHTALGLAQNIYAALVEADPGNEEYYSERMSALFDRLEGLDGDYLDILSSATKDTIIVSHTAYGYLADRYGFEQNGIVGMTAEEQPSTSTLVSIVELMEREGLNVMYVDPTYSDAYVEALESDVEERIDGDVRILKLYTMLGKVDGRSYLEQMEENLENLGEGLGVT